jgi:hypothetical protein
MDSERIEGRPNLADGNPKEPEKEAPRSGVRKKRSTEAFMRTMRQHAENADRGSRIAERQALISPVS